MAILVLWPRHGITFGFQSRPRPHLAVTYGCRFVIYIASYVIYHCLCDYGVTHSAIVWLWIFSDLAQDKRLHSMFIRVSTSKPTHVCWSMVSLTSRMTTCISFSNIIIHMSKVSGLLWHYGKPVYIVVWGVVVSWKAEINLWLVWR